MECSRICVRCTSGEKPIGNFKKGEIPLGKFERWLDKHHVQNRPISQLATAQHFSLVASSPSLSLWPSLLKWFRLLRSYFGHLKTSQRDCFQNGSVRFPIWKVTLTKSSGKVTDTCHLTKHNAQCFLMNQALGAVQGMFSYRTTGTFVSRTAASSSSSWR